MAKISIYLPDEDESTLNQFAASENRSVSNMVSTLVRQEASRRRVVNVTELPRPEGAQVVPVIEIER